MIYLDNAATTFPKPLEVWNTYETWQRNQCVNAGRGGYTMARDAGKVIADTREKMASYVGANLAEDVIFTPSATIAINMILQGLSMDENSFVYVSPYEHNAVMRTLYYLEKKKGLRWCVFPTTPEHRIDIQQSGRMFRENPPTHILMTQASNVTGYCLPYQKIFAEGKKYGAISILDSAQGLGVLPVHVMEENIDFLVFAGHKNLYGTLGAGGFVNAGELPLDCILFGGNGSDSLNLSLPERGISRYEVASPNLPAIAALGTALDIVKEQHKEGLNHERVLLGKLLGELREIQGITIFSNCLEVDERVGIASFACERYTSDELGMILDEDFDIAVRTGYHCAPLVHDIIGSKKYGGTVRVGVSKFTTDQELDALIKAMKELMEE